LTLLLYIIIFYNYVTKFRLRLANSIKKLCEVIFFHSVGNPVEDGRVEPKYARKLSVLNTYKLITLDTLYFTEKGLPVSMLA
jgi:hypothetical protein